MILEFCDIGDLKHHIDKHHGFSKTNKFIIYQLLKALKGLHNKDLMHRDMKPQNIFLMELPEDGF